MLKNILMTVHASGGAGNRTQTGPVTMGRNAQRRYNEAMARGDVEAARRISDRSFNAGMRARTRRGRTA